MIAIVAVDQNWGIGKDGEQMVYIPADLKRFRTLTTGNTIVLGRKTVATFPKGHPLKNRRNLILSRNPNYHPEGGEVFSTIDALMEQVTDPEHTYVVGGASVYQAMIEHCTAAYVTKIEQAYPVDCWFPNLDTSPDWEISDISEEMEHDGIKFRYVHYRRVNS